MGLSLKKHHFSFEIGDDFFTRYGNQLVQRGAFGAEVELDKRETMLEVRFLVTGNAVLTCDRSLDEFDHPMRIDRTIRFQYGTEAAELSEEIVLIPREQAQLDLGQYLYELIAVQVPMKKLHPRFHEEDDDEQDRLVYSSAADTEANENEEPVDPRWEKLKKLK